MDSGFETLGIYRFGRFRLDPVSRTLARDGAQVKLAPRLFDTLYYLVQNHGRLIDRTELLQAVWPGRTVEDNNLLKAISSLRLAMKGEDGEEGFILNVPGRGYRFAASVTFEAVAPLFQSDAPPSALPAAEPGQASAFAQRRRSPWVVAALALFAAFVWYQRPLVSGKRTAPITAFSPPPNSVAVLPFTNLGGDPNTVYLSDGLSNELINALGRIQTLQVAARMSSFSFKGRQMEIGDIARKLNVGTVLEGSVQREGTAVRVKAELIDATTGFQLWSQNYDSDQKGLLAMQKEIAEAVIASLKVVLLPDDSAKLTQGGTANDSAFDAYLSGMAALRDTESGVNPRAITAFSEAIMRDPVFALAYVQRARALAFSAVTDSTADLAGQRKKLDVALADARRAVGLAPELGAAHAALALVLKFGLSHFDEAYAEIRRAMALAPGDAATLKDYAFFELELGHTATAIAAGERMVAINPLAPKAYYNFAAMLAYGHHFNEAFVALHRAEALRRPGAPKDHVHLAWVEQMLGDARAARQTCAGALDYSDLVCLAWANHALGMQAEAEAALAKLHAMLSDNGAFMYAHIAAQWGRQDEALRWLKRAYALRDAGLTDMRIDPALDPVRNTQVYRDIEAALGFPP